MGATVHSQTIPTGMALFRVTSIHTGIIDLGRLLRVTTKNFYYIRVSKDFDKMLAQWLSWSIKRLILFLKHTVTAGSGKTSLH